MRTIFLSGQGKVTETRRKEKETKKRQNSKNALS